MPFLDSALTLKISLSHLKENPGFQSKKVVAVLALAGINLLAMEVMLGHHLQWAATARTDPAMKMTAMHKGHSSRVSSLIVMLRVGTNYLRFKPILFSFRWSRFMLYCSEV